MQLARIALDTLIPDTERFLAENAASRQVKKVPGSFSYRGENNLEPLLLKAW
jgi:hypothetical protein